MLIKTQGIVLQTIRHSDSGIIAHILSSEYGLISVVVKGVHSKKRGHMSAYFQTLQILNLEIYYKESRNLQNVKEVSLVESITEISSDFSKNAIAYFVGEVLKKTLNENEANIQIFNYVKDSIIFLNSNDNISNFHIGFLIGLAGFLGIAPSGKYLSSDCYFDMQNGYYVSTMPLHGYYIDAEFSSILHSFSNCTLQECNNIKLNGTTRSKFLDIILTYFSFHLPGLKKIKSLEVLSQMFSQQS